MRRRSRCERGLLMAAFGIGAVLACCFPEKYLIVILAAALVCCGVMLFRSR